MKRHLSATLLVATALLGLGASQAGAGSSQLLLPDLTTVPAYLQNYRIKRTRGQVRLVFGAAIFNIGPGPLEMLGSRRSRRAPMEATQVVYRSDGSTTSFSIGEWEYHAPHHHWHVLDVADYRLLDGNGTVVATTPKVSYFLEDTTPIDRSIPGAPRVKVYRFHGRDRSRGTLKLRTGISVGWADVYDASVPGQYIDVTGLPSGDYTLQVEVNPTGVLMENDTSNNVVSVPVRL